MESGRLVASLLRRNPYRVLRGATTMVSGVGTANTASPFLLDREPWYHVVLTNTERVLVETDRGILLVTNTDGFGIP